MKIIVTCDWVDVDKIWKELDCYLNIKRKKTESLIPGRFTIQAESDDEWFLGIENKLKQKFCTCEVKVV